MRLHFTVTRVAAQLEITVEFDHISRRDQERWALEAGERWKAVAQAVAAAPESAATIIGSALEEYG